MNPSDRFRRAFDRTPPLDSGATWLRAQQELARTAPEREVNDAMTAEPSEWPWLGKEASK